MADETKPNEVEETQAETAEEEIDWKAEAEKWKAQSRSWEKQSKANKKAADELEQLKAEQMTEQEKAVARAEKAEAELAKLVAKSEHDDAAKRVSEKSGVPIGLLDFCADEEAMEAFAKEWVAQQQPTHAAPAARGSNVVRGGEKAPSNAEIFGAFMSEQMKH